MSSIIIKYNNHNIIFSHWSHPNLYGARTSHNGLYIMISSYGQHYSPIFCGKDMITGLIGSEIQSLYENNKITSFTTTIGAQIETDKFLSNKLEKLLKLKSFI